MNHVRLFEELVYELQRLIASSTEYDLLKSSKILRQLLLDGDALLHLVNRELRAAPRFRVRIREPANDDASYFEPSIFPFDESEPIRDLTLQQFLAHQVGKYDGSAISVRQVIKFAAVVLGGVHFKIDRDGEYAAVAYFHKSNESGGLTPVLEALRQISAVSRDALFSLRDLVLGRERFEKGRGWTALLFLEILPSPPDEDNYILDIGIDEHRNRLSVYLDARGELTFRIIDGFGVRRYLRSGKVDVTDERRRRAVIVCELSTVDNETLLSLRTEEWDHVEIVEGNAFNLIGNPFHYVTGSDCRGKKSSYIFVRGELLIARPLTQLELSQAIAYFAEKAANAEIGLHYHGNQYMYSIGHPNFLATATPDEPECSQGTPN